MVVTIDDLQACHEAVRGNLTDFTRNIREGKEIKINDLKSYFTVNTGWLKIKQANGHKKFIHKVTRIVIEYQAHSNKKDTSVKPRIVAHLLDQVQQHINIIGNDIWGYNTKTWEVDANYKQALIKYNQWLNKI